LACGTGNAALLAAAQGASVVGVDSAPRLLDIARERAQAEGVELDLREGDLLALPIGDAAADAVLSVFGVIFASDPAQSLREIARVLRPGGRALLSAWVPAGPIDAMLGAMGRILARITQSSPPQRFAWPDSAAVGARRRNGARSQSHDHRRAADSGHLPRSVCCRGSGAPDGSRGTAGRRAGRCWRGSARGDDQGAARGQRRPGRLPHPQPVRRARDARRLNKLERRRHAKHRLPLARRRRTFGRGAGPSAGSCFGRKAKVASRSSLGELRLAPGLSQARHTLEQSRETRQTRIARRGTYRVSPASSTSCEA